jgi:hypothetical protein
MKRLLLALLTSLFAAACFAPYTFDPIQRPATEPVGAIGFEIVIGKTTKGRLVEMAGQPTYVDVYSSGEILYYEKKQNVIYDITVRMRDGTTFTKSYTYFTVTVSNGVATTFGGRDT